MGPSSYLSLDSETHGWFQWRSEARDIVGQRARGVSVHCHLLRDEPLFSSAILQSGLIRVCVMSVDEYQIYYEKMLVELSISIELSPSERAEKLLAVDTTTVTAAMIPVFIIPVITMAYVTMGLSSQVLYRRHRNTTSSKYHHGVRIS